MFSTPALQGSPVLSSAALIAATAMAAPAAAPTFSYFDPPKAPDGATVTLVGESLAGATSVSLFSPALIDEAIDWPFVQVSDQAISFAIPGGVHPSFDLEMSAWVVSPGGVTVVVPDDTTVVNGRSYENSRPEPMVKVPAGFPVELYNSSAATFYLEAGANAKLTNNFYGYFFLEEGATLDLTPMSGFGGDVIRVYHEPGAQVIGLDEIFGDPGRSEFVAYEVPEITAAPLPLLVRDPIPPAAVLSVNDPDGGSIAVEPAKPAYYVGDEVTFTATGGEGSAFLDWQPPFAGMPNPMKVVLQDDTVVGAELVSGHPVSVVARPGSVTLSPDRPLFSPGQEVTATFHPGFGETFAGWTGDIEADENPVTFLVGDPVEIGVSVDAPAEAELLWSFQPHGAGGPPATDADGWTGIAVAADGGLVAGYDSGGLTGSVVAIGGDGSERWTRVLPGALRWTGSYGLGVPVVGSGGRIYVAAGDISYCFEAGGDEVWRRICVFDRRSVTILDPAVANDGATYLADEVSDRDGLLRVNPETGVPLASIASGAGVASFGYPLHVSIDTDGSVVLPSDRSSILRLHRNLGSVLWSADTGDDVGRDIGAPGAIDNSGRYLRPIGGFLNIFGSDGQLLLRDERYPLATTAPVISEAGDIVFTTREGLLVCLDGESFDEKWVRQGFANQSPLAAADGTIYAVGDNPWNPVVHALDAAGAPLWRFSGILDPAPPTAELVGDDPGPPAATLAVGRDGTLYVGARNGFIYALQGSAPLATSSWPKAFASYNNGAAVQPLAPRIDAQPVGGNAVGGTPFELSVRVSARPAATVQWYRDGSPLAGATSPALVLDDPEPGDAGAYFARVSSELGTVDSSPAVVTVGYGVAVGEVPHVTVVQEPAGAFLQPGTEVTFTAVPEPGFEFVVWTGSSTSTENPLVVELAGTFELSPVVADAAPPAVELVSPLAGTTEIGRVDLAGSAVDNGGVASLTWSLNGSDAAALALGAEGVFLVEGIPLLIGPNTFQLVATDPSGNITVVDRTVTWQPPRTVLLGDAMAREGMAVQLPLRLASAGEVGGMTLRLTYNPDYLQEPVVEFAEVLAGAFTTANTGTPGEIQLSFASTGSGLEPGDVVFATVGFRARSVPGDLESLVEVEILDLADVLGGAFETGNASAGGAVSISPRSITGDINANGRLDVGDAHRLQQLLVGDELARPWDVGLNDLNGTGSLDAGDLIRILRASAGIDPQPEPGGGEPVAAALRAALPEQLLESAGLFLELEGDGSVAGENVTVRVVAGTLDPETAGAAFSLKYPAEALRLAGPASHSTGAAAPTGTSGLWNVSPAVNDYQLQDGVLAYAGSSENPWEVAPGTVVAEVEFEVQPGAVARDAWPVYLTSAETPVDAGYATAAVPDQHRVFVPAPVSFDAWRAVRFTAAQLDDPGVSGFDADPDGDLRPNGVEFFAGSEPFVPDAGAVVEPIVFAGAGGEPLFAGVEFRRDLTRAGIGSDLQASAGNGDWSTEGVGGFPELVSRVLEPDGTTETVAMRYRSPIGAGAPRLVRLQVWLEEAGGE